MCFVIDFSMHGNLGRATWMNLGMEAHVQSILQRDSTLMQAQKNSNTLNIETMYSM